METAVPPPAHVPQDPEVLYSAHGTQQLLMRYEAALARVQARRGIIPVQAAREIERTASTDFVTPEAVAEARKAAGHPMVSLIRAWTAVLRGDAAQWLHYGATTQDAMDTVQLLQLRMATRHVVSLMRDAEGGLLRLAAEHRATPMIGRTVGRHALPITFGLKVASWMTENRRSIERLDAWCRHSDTGMLSGAVGTYAALGDDALALEAEVLQEFGVGAPLAADWKGSRDMHAEFGALASIAAGTWRRIAQEIFLLQGDDIRELEDPSGFVGSSTMPHKANPDNARHIIAIARRIGRESGVLLDWMVSIHERDQISNADSLGVVATDLSRMMAIAVRMVNHLVVRPGNMRNNIDRTNGLIMAEPAMFLLGAQIGKQHAHGLVRRVAAQARQSGRTLVDELRDAPEVQALAQRPDLDSLADPTQYLGDAIAVVDRAVAAIEAARIADGKTP